MWAWWLQIPLGLLVGYVAASVSESLQHRVFGHRSRWLRHQTRHLPALSSFLDRIYWSHTVIHHGRTFQQDFVTAFRGPAEQERLLSSLSATERQLARRTQFGLTIPFESWPWFLWLPLLAALGLGWQVGFPAGLAALPPLLLPPVLSRWIHPLVHRRYQEALAAAPGVTRWLLRSVYGRAMIRHHWLHHRYPRSNFNLLLLGDWLLGTYRTASEQDLREMHRIGLPVD